MPEPTTPVTELTSQYVSQVTNDLDNNVKEQERITAEIAGLQEQLAALEHDHTVLVSMRQALGVASRPSAPATADAAVVPAPRTKSTTGSGTRRAPKKTTDERSEREKQPAKKPAADKSAVTKPAPKKTAAKKTAGQTAQPTLVELVRRLLAEQQEPRSAAEVSEALGSAHPDRQIQTKVIRTTLENLVARNSAQRTKQGSSVFYTLQDGAEPTAANTGDSRPEPAE
ncbi:hypothetical protein AB0L59_36460 [Streptomyces sp. NPDC052109]|uniref:hypothetical protein n=1 Tax=Streptomyces sp. NPDC052109 TaxID=3155527 RepID=UPI00343DA006